MTASKFVGARFRRENNKAGRVTLQTSFSNGGRGGIEKWPVSLEAEERKQTK